MRADRNGPGMPSQSCGRSTYETGQGTSPSAPAQGLVGNVIPIANAREATALVAQTKFYMTSLEATFTPNEAVTGEFWLLAWDVAATQAAADAYPNGGLGAARYSYGPITMGTSGALLEREPQELFVMCYPDGSWDEFMGAPFDFGAFMALSSTPIEATPIDAAIMHLVVRRRPA